MTVPGATPPVLAGLTFLQPIGTGGFADVYLYRQEFPARPVAVKVLRESADAAGVAQFRAEANVMAQLSGHPSIVPIFQADVSPDGHAYLVMEYCPPPHLAQRFRTERLAAPEVLDLGVKISSAVETAHRVGILHRDIKPHNILTSVYGAPLLTDFGIASVAGDVGGGTEAMSVPWSPPEIFAHAALLDVRSDVYSLAATVYSLLAGRSPFEVPGAANDNATLIHRIERQRAARILRADVPDSLNDLLIRALSQRLEDRPSSAMAFARALQEVQIELHLPPTRLEVLDASPQAGSGGAPVGDARTEVKPISIIVPDEIATRGTLLRPRSITLADDRSAHRTKPPSPTPDTIRQPIRLPGQPPEPTPSTPPGTASRLGPRPSAPPASPPPGALSGTPAGVQPHATTAPPAGPALTSPTPVPQPAREQRGAGIGRIVLGGLLVAAILSAVAAGLLLGKDADPDPEPPRTTPTDVPRIQGGPAQPRELTVSQGDGEIRFSWSNPAPVDGDLYLVQVGPTLAGLTEVARAPERQIVVPAEPGEQVCLSVSTVREATVSPALTECVAAR